MATLTPETIEALRAWRKPAEPVTRADLATLRPMDLPLIRCRLENVGDKPGRLIPDVNPWVETWTADGWRAEQFSWELVLEVMNDPHAAPLWFWAK